MDTKIKNTGIALGLGKHSLYGHDWAEETTEERAPHPLKPHSRTAHLYDILSSLGGSATLTGMWKIIPASDLAPKPKNKQELRKWLSQSGTSKGYITKTKKDHYRIATLEEYRTIFGRNKATHRRYLDKQIRQEARAAAKAATPNPVAEQPVVKQPVVEQSVMEKPENPLKFMLEYVGALLGATSAIVLFYAVLKVV